MRNKYKKIKYQIKTYIKRQYIETKTQKEEIQKKNI